MWHISITGNPKEMGEAYAKLLREKILYYLQETKKTLNFDQSRERIAATVKRVFGNIAAAFPYLAEEIEGCASELGVSNDDIVMLIAFNDLWWGIRDCSVVMSKQKALGDCTNLGFRTNCPEPMLGQTYDIPDPAKMFVQSVSPRKGFRMLIVHRIAPAHATTGMNEHGLCLAAVSSDSNAQNLDGVPVNVLRRAVLQNCASIADAVKLVRKHRIISGGYTWQVMQSDGKSVVLEISAAHVEVVDSDRPYLYNTRFVSPVMQQFYANLPKEKTALRAEKRLKTFERLMQGEKPPYTYETMKRALSDHSPEGPIYDWTTHQAVVMFPARRTLYVHEGAPDVTDPDAYVLQEER